MKALLVIAVIVLGVALIYTFQKDRDRRIDESATAQAALVTKNRPQTLSSLLAPYHEQLFAKIEHRRPTNLVPPLQAIRQRVAIKHQVAQPARRDYYDAGLRALDQMIAVAAERTRTLETVVRIAARPAPALEQHKRGETSNTFFLETAVKGWENTRAQRKAVVDGAMAQVQQAEANLIRALGAEAVPEHFDLPDLTPVYVRAEAPGPAGTLDRRP